jgi:hypothetical protein
VRWRADQRKGLEQLCRYIIANERLKRNCAGKVVLKLKSAYEDGSLIELNSRSTESRLCAGLESVTFSRFTAIE